MHAPVPWLIILSSVQSSYVASTHQGGDGTCRFITSDGSTAVIVFTTALGVQLLPWQVDLLLGKYGDQ